MPQALRTRSAAVWSRGKMIRTHLTLQLSIDMPHLATAEDSFAPNDRDCGSSQHPNRSAGSDHFKAECPSAFGGRQMSSSERNGGEVEVRAGVGVSGAGPFPRSCDQPLRRNIAPGSFLLEAPKSGVVGIVPAKIAGVVILILILILVLVLLRLVVVVLVLLVILVPILLRQIAIGGAAARTPERARLVSAKAGVITKHRSDAVEQEAAPDHARCRRRGGAKKRSPG